MLRVWAIAAGVATAWVLWPVSEASACSTFAQLGDAIPADGSHPANAAVILRGSALSIDLISATIDGAPVEVLLDDALSIDRGVSSSNPSYWDVLAVRFDPAPLPGQTVVVTGTACDFVEECPPFEVAYLATEADEVIADDLPSISFDLARYTTPWMTSCGDYGSVVLTTLELGPDAFVDEAFVVLDVRAHHLGAGIEDVRRVDASQWLDPVHYLDTGIVGPAFPIDGWCIQVTARDAAGNVGGSVTHCDACLFAEGESGVELPNLDWYPVPGGPCDDGSGATTGTSAGSGTDTSAGGDDSTSAAPPIDPPDPQGTEGPAGDGSTTDLATSDGGAVQDDVSDRGCACGSGRSEPALLLALLYAVRRRRRP